ncbi:unnamed protein product [Sphagnum troendelagicum]|uniref:LysM domain-containing protein n=1 Tax=Sphagnum troendelagicum TaxID=128251 RepID=A0ABP0UZT2_9BRYO
MCKLAGQMVSWWIVVAMAMAVFKHDGVDGVFTEPCSSTSSNCTALVSYTAPANSTLAKVADLFGVSDIDSLLGANDFNLSTPATLALSPGDFLKVPVTCNCINGTRQSNSTIYEVVAGDTLSVIAGTTYQDLITYQQIAAANGIVDVNKIQIGESLVIPFPCGCNPLPDQPVVYLAYPVQSGDSIANISADFGAQMADVLSLNGIVNASDLQVGSVLEVPVPACQASFSQSSVDSGLLVAEGGYELTAAKCVQCICTDAPQLRCIPTPTSFSNPCLATLNCANSSLTIGEITTSPSSTGCDVTSCNYEGYLPGNDNAIISQVVNSTENQCPVIPSLTYDIPAPIGKYPLPPAAPTPGPTSSTSGAPAPASAPSPSSASFCIPSLMSFLVPLVLAIYL